jgi:hypothetical protein
MTSFPKKRFRRSGFPERCPPLRGGFFMAEWLIVPFQAGCMNRVVERRSMIHRYVTNIPIRWGKLEGSNLPVFRVADKPLVISPPPRLRLSKAGSHTGAVIR